MNRLRIRQLLEQASPGNAATVLGWVRTVRKGKAVLFVEVNDGSCLASLQCVIDRASCPLGEETERQLSTGASIRVEGLLQASPGSGQAVELAASTLEITGPAPAETYPLQKKHHSFEFLREIAHLRARTNTFGAVARVRNCLSWAVHRFFQERGFLYVHTPIITASDCEGAGAMFQVTTLDIEKPGGVDYSQDFFGRKAHLTVSGQLEGETYACALGDIYTFGPTFRAENSNTTRHLAEFWMIEPEMAFCDIVGNMDTAEAFLKYLIRAVLTECAADLDFFNQRIQPGLVASLEAVANSSFMRMSYTEAVSRLQESGQTFEFPVKWGIDLQSEHEKYLTEEICGGPVILTDYPKGIKAFYMMQNDDGKTVRAMDVLVPRLGEIIGGSQREHRLDVLETRMADLGLNPADYWWYLDLRRFGTVPHAGFGLGFERMVQYVTGMQNIRDVIPYPRTVHSADF